MALNVNLIRQLIIETNQLRRIDDKFTFYYDETNNIRKFYLTDTGTNVPEHNNFVLGGIVLAEGNNLPDITHLRTKLQMQSNAPEIKFIHVAKGDFEQVLASKNLRIILSWIIENGISIHYSSVNIIYWTIVDIIDSILTEDQFKQYQQYHQHLKNELYRIANLNKSAFLALLKRHRYPNIKRVSTSEFIADVQAYINTHCPDDDKLPTTLLSALIEKSASLPELAFLVDEEDDMLIESFTNFYTQPMMIFKNATHIFDREIQIERILDSAKFKDSSRPVNYSFSDSKSTPGIQIADVVTGFLGKYQCFVEKHSLPELLRRKNLWNDNQIANFTLLRDLINQADAVSNAFINRITALDSIWKDESFLHELPAKPHLL